MLSDEHFPLGVVGVPSASGITTLRVTATYEGGAAGHYAFYSTTGGTNKDSGRFTARATLEVNFNTDKATGVIDQFTTGTNGQSRNWSVVLKESGISNGHLEKLPSPPWQSWLVHTKPAPGLTFSW